MKQECCNIKRVEIALKSLGKEQLEEIIKEDKKAEVVCPCCNKKYHFEEKDLIRILSDI